MIYNMSEKNSLKIASKLLLDGEIINAIQLFGMALIMGGVFINSKKD